MLAISLRIASRSSESVMPRPARGGLLWGRRPMHDELSDAQTVGERNVEELDPNELRSHVAYDTAHLNRSRVVIETPRDGQDVAGAHCLSRHDRESAFTDLGNEAFTAARAAVRAPFQGDWPTGKSSPFGIHTKGMVRHEVTLHAVDLCGA